MYVDILQLHHIIGTFTEQLSPSSMADYCSSSNNINVSSSSNSTGLWTCFNGWLLQQRQELDELLEASATFPPNPAHLRLLVDKILTHFEEYRKQRSGFSERDASIMLCPPWCSSLENSLLWLGGCRPSLAIRLVYSLAGSDIEFQLESYLKGETKGNVAEITARQINLINALHARTVKEEEGFDSKMASLQEDIADEPLASIMRELGGIEETNDQAERALEAHAAGMGRMVVDADNLRMNTLKQLLGILTPLQGVEFLVSTKKLHLSVHHWGKKRDTSLYKPTHKP